MLLEDKTAIVDVTDTAAMRAHAAEVAASDWAATMTAAEINLTGGVVID